jgi:Skp family chaperone for outer membrane proteins
MRGLLLAVLSLLLASCQSTNHGSAAQSGYPDLGPLVAQVAQARDAQQTAVEQFQSTRAQLSGLANVAGGDLQAHYAATANQYDASVEAAVAVGSANAAVDETASALFQQWQVETEAYTDPSLKAESQARLAQTLRGYESMIRVLRQPEATMTAVLAALNDNVTYLQHNLDASAVAARRVELGAIEDEILVLIQQMNNAIASAGDFSASVQR